MIIRGGYNMSEKFLYLMATFDDKSSETVKEIEYVIKEAGIVGKQTPNLPPHITIASFDVSDETEIKQKIQDVSNKIRSFNLSFNHIGLFGLKVMFLAPDVNYEFLELQRQFDDISIKSSRGWTAHVTVLIDDSENIQKALPLVAQNFQQLNARVESLRLYEFFPTRFIEEFSLKKEE